MKVTIKTRRHNGGAVARYNSPTLGYEAYGQTPSMAIKNLAMLHFAPETSTHQSLVWFAHLVAMGNAIPSLVGIQAAMGNVAAIANAWFRTTNDSPAAQIAAVRI